MAPSEDGLAEAVYLLPQTKTAGNFSLHLVRPLPLRGAVQGTFEAKQTITPLSRWLRQDWGSVFWQSSFCTVNYRLALRPTQPPISRTIAIGYKDKSSLPIASKCLITYLTENICDLP